MLHPRRVTKGVVAGVRDYGNRMGIPTVNGAVYFDPRYLGNPLVYCGNIGLIPRDKSRKEPTAGDLIVALGGRTGRDGIHGATFSSAELTSQSETVSGGAVQIGNAITEKMLLDVLLAARDRGLYHAVTDCGAGGFSSAVGEMGEKIGAEVWLDRVPLKYEGLSYTEIWISEAQERMVLSVPPEKWDELSALCASEGVEATVIGRFVPTGRLVLKYRRPTSGRPGDGVSCTTAGRRWSARRFTRRRPPSERCIRCRGFARAEAPVRRLHRHAAADPRLAQRLQQGMGHPPVRPRGAGRQRGQAAGGRRQRRPERCRRCGPCWTAAAESCVACGMNPCYGDWIPTGWPPRAIDEAMRNCVAVGADPRRIAILDNFCWGNTDRPETLGSLVRAALACYDVATVLGTPFISGKDSLNNEFRPKDAAEPISIPPSLLISALGQVDDVARCVTMDLKEPGNLLYLVGPTRTSWAARTSLWSRDCTGGQVPAVDPPCPAGLRGRAPGDPRRAWSAPATT